jgi:Asp/Glu/hydantoin racemase
MSLKREPILGVLMLKTGFPRPPGDVGNPQTWSCTTRYKVVEPANVDSVVNSGPLPIPLLKAFVDAGWALVGEGATLITTSCGFLVTAQKTLQDALPVPVVTSSLLQVAAVQATLPPGRRVGVLTFDAERLSSWHMEAAGAPADTAVVGLATGSELHRVVTGDLSDLDVAGAEAAVLAAGRRLLATWPDIGAVVLECTNMPPYRDALARELGLPVHDLVTLIEGRIATR